MSKVSGFNWSDNIEDYKKAMSWGHGYGGEAYWQEEENWLIENFSDKGIGNTLSVGCGLFRELETLKKITKTEIIGLDYEQKFVDYLKGKGVQQNQALPYVKIAQGDAQDLKFPQNSFDLSMILFASIGHMPDMKKIVESLVSVTKKGGCVVISLWKDSAEVNEHRARTYGGYKEGRSFAIEENTHQGIRDLIIYKDGQEFYRSGIIEKDYMIDLIKSVSPNASIEVYDLEYCSIFVIKK